MELVRTLSEFHALKRELVLLGHGVHSARPVTGLTPTMGALHSGHRTLIERMSRDCDLSIVSLFVNPRQFGAGEDLSRYPRSLDADLKLCASAGADIVFAPSVEEMYPESYATTIHVAGLAERWCGASRPGHFDGVCTVVAKLFLICQPERAYFGEKDFQQLVVIKRMVADLDLGVEIVPCQIIRELSGLALSSRNTYLSPKEKVVAGRLYQGLMKAETAFASGTRGCEALKAAANEVLSYRQPNVVDEPLIEVEYLAVVDPETLMERSQAENGDRMLVAARLGSTRLIDNIALAGAVEA
jgi:pantoate--beta-alanine ligase